MEKRYLICENCGRKYDITHKRSVETYPKACEIAKNDPLTRNTVYDGYMWQTTDPSIIRCFAKGHSIALIEINELGYQRFLHKK